MTNGSFEYLINFALNLKTDPKQIQKVSKELSDQFSELAVGVKIDKDEAQKNLESFLTELSKLDIEEINLDFNSDKAKASAEDLLRVFQGADLDIFSNIDTSKLDGLAKSFNDVFTGNDFDKIIKELNEVGDSQAFNDLLKDIEKLQSEINKINIDDLDGITNELNGALEKAEKNLKEFIATNKQALSAMEATGKKGSAEYEKLAKDINEAENQLNKFSDSAKNTGLEDLDLGGFASTFAKFQAIGLAGQALNDFAQNGIQARDAMLNLEAKTGLTGEALEKLKIQAEDAFISGIGENLGEAIDVMGTADQLLGDFLNPDDLILYTKRAGALAQVFDKDINEVLGGSRTFIKQFELDGVKSADLVSFAMQNLGSKMDDALDTLDEYSGLAKLAGFEAEEFLGTLKVGIDNGARDTDKIADAIKETQIRINSGDYESAFDGLIEGANEAESAILATQKAILDQASAGEISIKEAIQKTSEITEQAFEAGDITSAFRDKLNVAVSGTPAEDIGGELYTRIFSAEIDPKVIQEQGKKAGEQIQNALGSVTILEKLGKEFELISAKAGEYFAPLVAGAGTVVTSVSQIAPALQLVNNVDLSKVKSQFEGFSNSFNNIVSKSPALSKAFSSITGSAGGLGGTLKGLVPLLTNPFVLGGAAIAVFLTQTEKGNEILSKFGEKGKELFEKFKPIGDFFSNVLGVVIEGLGDLLFGLVDTIGVVIESAIEIGSALASINPLFIGISEALNLFGNSVEGSADGANILVSALEKFFEFLSMIPLGINVAVKAFKGLFIGLPELFIAFLELAKEAVNPVNWFNGDNISKATDKFKGVVNGMLGEAKNEIIEYNLGKSFEEALETKSKLGKVAAIEDLLSQYENATDEIEKNSIAETISKDFPEVANNFKYITDANGEMIKVLDLNIDKVKELADERKSELNSDLMQKQKNYVDSIKAQSTAYEEARAKAKELSEQQTKAVAKGDIGLAEDLKEQYNEANKIAQKEGEKLREQLTESNKIGVRFDNVELSPEVEKDFANELTQLRSVAEQLNIGDEITKTIQIQGKIDKNNELGSLVKEYENATDQLEKEGLARKIQAQAPELIKATGQVVDENGRLIQTYEVAKDKVDDYVKSQNEINGEGIKEATENIISGIQKEVDARDKLGDEIIKKRKEINDALAQDPSADVSQLEKEYDELFTKANNSTKQVVSYLAQSKNASIDLSKEYKGVAEQIGVSEDELVKMVEKQAESLKSSKDLNKAVEDLAASWEKVNSELDSNIKKQTSQLSEIRRRLNEDNDLTKEQRKELQEQYEELRKTTIDQVKQAKNLERIEESILIATGQKEIKGKSLLELAKEEAGRRSTILDIGYKDFELKQNQLVLSKDIASEEIKELNLLAEQNKVVNQQRTAWIEILKQRKLIKDFNEETGEVEFYEKSAKQVEAIEKRKLKALDTLQGEYERGIIKSEEELQFKREQTIQKFEDLKINIKPAEKDEILGKVLELNKSVQDNQSKIDSLLITVEKDSEQIRREIEELNKERVEWEVGLTLSQSGVYEREVERLKGNLDVISNEIEKFNIDLYEIEKKKNKELELLGDNASEAQIKIINNKYEKEANEIKKKLLEKEKAEFETNKSILENQNAYYELRLSKIKEYNDKIRQSTIYEYDKSIEDFQDYLDSINSIRGENNATTEEKEIESIEKIQEKRIEKLQEYLDLEAISVEEFERRKTRILEEGEEERAKLREKYKEEEFRLANVQAGELLFLESQKALALAIQEKESSEETIKILEEKFKNQNKIVDIEKIKEIQNDLLEAEKALEENRFDEKAKLQKENSEKLLEQNLTSLTESERQSLTEATRLFTESQALIEEKGDLLKQSLGIFEGSFIEGLQGLFEGDEAALENSMKGFLQKQAGFLKKQLEGFVLGLILSPGVQSQVNIMPFPLNTIALAGITLAIKKGVSAIADPVIKGLTSFASGGRVDQPTYAVIGDGSKLGSSNREWVFRDEQLKQTIMMANEMQSSSMANRLLAIENAISGLRLESVLRGDDLVIVVNNVNNKRNNRMFVK